MCYMPLKGETDTSYIVKQAFLDGKRVALPVTSGDDATVEAYYIDQDTTFKKGMFDVLEPVCKDKADIGDIDVVIVPGIAFDTNGARIGFGKGCYDRFLEAFSGVKVGYCYGFQIYDNVPCDEYDIMMDYIVSDIGIAKIK